MRGWAKLTSVMTVGLLAGCASAYSWTTPGIPPVMPVTAKDVAALARGSTCASHHWANGQGRAPGDYTEGVALVFARALCHPERAEVAAASAPTGRPNGKERDALDHYAPELQAIGMTGNEGPEDRLRFAYVVLIGLGMEESSGRHCLGRWMEDPYAEHDSAEAGIFQASYGARRYHASLEPLYQRYKADESGCMLATFSPGISCPEEDKKNWGEGEGVTWQGLTKRCPAFSTEYGVVVLRHGGGAKGEYGPMRRKSVQISNECNLMFQGIQKLVKEHPEVCAGL